MCSVRYGVCSVQCAVYNMQCTVCNVQCTVCNSVCSVMGSAVCRSAGCRCVVSVDSWSKVAGGRSAGGIY